jgi:hypothetical protein
MRNKKKRHHPAILAGVSSIIITLGVEERSAFRKDHERGGKGKLTAETSKELKGRSLNSSHSGGSSGMTLLGSGDPTSTPH